MFTTVFWHFFVWNFLIILIHFTLSTSLVTPPCTPISPTSHLPTISGCPILNYIYTISPSLQVGSASYSSRPVSVYQWHAHIRAVVFHSLHRSQRDTRLCTLIMYSFLLCTIYCCSVPIVLLYLPSFTLLSRLLPPPLLPLPMSLPDQFPPIPATASLIAPLVPFLTPHIGLTVII